MGNPTNQPVIVGWDVMDCNWDFVGILDGDNQAISSNPIPLRLNTLDMFASIYSNSIGFL
jgi:hypothetical protein